MENTMSKVMKVIEVLAESPNSWEDAVTAAVAKASESVHGIRSVYVKNFEAQIDNDKVVNYRINAMVTFAVDCARPTGLLGCKPVAALASTRQPDSFLFVA
jgi:flavin-binding protein dodecin